jgi:hypothetical protein
MCVRKIVSNKECKCDQLRVLSRSVATFKVRREGQLADLWLTLQSSRLIAQEQESQVVRSHQTFICNDYLTTNFSLTKTLLEYIYKGISKITFTTDNYRGIDKIIFIRHR